MQENAASRDFTVNALFYDPFSRLLLDYVGGMRDCKQRRLRTVIDPRESFEEDPCRLLRAIRHAARGGVPRMAPDSPALFVCAVCLLSNTLWWQKGLAFDSTLGKTDAGLKIDPPTRKAMREGAPLLYSVNQVRPRADGGRIDASLRMRQLPGAERQALCRAA